MSGSLFAIILPFSLSTKTTDSNHRQLDTTNPQSAGDSDVCVENTIKPTLKTVVSRAPCAATHEAVTTWTLGHLVRVGTVLPLYLRY